MAEHTERWVLNHLIETCRDGGHGFRYAANHVATPSIKSLFLDIVKVLSANGFTADQIPAKIEGVAFGPDVPAEGGAMHTIWIANDNDFLQDLNGPGTNPNQFLVFGFKDADLNGSKFVPQQRFGLLD